MNKKIIKSIIAIACTVVLASPLSAFAASTRIKGDVNGDGTVNIDDFFKIKELIGEDSAISYADMNDDGTVSMMDVLILKKKVTTNVSGDVDGNGIVDLRDYNRLFKYTGSSDVHILESNADLDNDGSITLKDSILLKKRIANRIKGDINGDGKVDNEDITLLKSYLTGQEVEIVNESSDLNGDGLVNIADLAVLNDLVNV